MHKRCWKLQSTAICRLSTLLQGRGCNEYLLVTSFRIHLTSSSRRPPTDSLELDALGVKWIVCNMFI